MKEKVCSPNKVSASERTADRARMDRERESMQLSIVLRWALPLIGKEREKKSRSKYPLTGIHPDIQTKDCLIGVAEIDSSIIHSIISNPQLLPGAFEGRAILGGKE